MPNAFDLHGRGPSNRRLFLEGVALVVLSVLIAVLLVAKSQGHLDRYVRVSAELINVGDGLPEKSDVKFRGVLVGSVTSVTPAKEGHPNIVRMNLKPRLATGIPASVTARVVPSNVFAVSSVQLVDNGDQAGPLASGMVVSEDQTLPTVLFQNTLKKFREVLSALGRQPASDNVGWLTALGEATSGRGDRLRQAGGDLNEIVNQLNGIVVGNELEPSTLSALTAATSGLRDTAPELLDALDSAVQPMRTLAEKRSQLTDLIGGGLGTTGTIGAAFENNTDRMIQISTDLTPVIGVLADHGDTLHAISSRLTTLVGRVMDVAWNHDTNQLQAQAIISLTPSRTYVRSDCPRYGDMAGPSCFTAPEVPTAPELSTSLESRGFPLPPGVNENRPNLAPPRDSVLPPAAPPTPTPPAPGPPLPAEAPAPAPVPDNGVQPQAASIESGVGPVGSSTEKHQLGRIMGGEVSSSTEILLGPLVRGMTVRINNDGNGQ
ncbi:MCE family protein [Mycolicibacterium sp. 050232]|uniref:MlaD family protein n=1 Tax=Mycolicibacterium sp. 050232 TaxID=3113982 RepID=UPI002E2902BE|nr:MCE family protein [Mycolicibacterium sp. 050232]MED5813335.1 MCE family protein [Mycolicibacterium sp. 050232]